METYKGKLEQNSAVYIEGQIEEKFFRNPDERKEKGDPPYVLKIKNVIHLGNVTETFIKGFAIYVTTPMLNDGFRQDLTKLLKNNKGNVPLTMFLFDPVTRYNIEFLSRKFQVSINHPFIENLQEMNIHYKVLKK